MFVMYVGTYVCVKYIGTYVVIGTETAKIGRSK